MGTSLILSNEYLVQKRNVLNEMRAIGWVAQELRFFALYLSKVNRFNIEATRRVRFTLSEFADIMELKRAQAKDLQPITDSLLRKIVHVPIDNGKRGYDSFQLFRRCRVEKSELDGEWYIDFDAHDEAIPLISDFLNNYVSYKIINVLKLRGANHFRMYEILKQHENEKGGVFTIDLPILRDRLGIEPTEYPRWERFKSRILDDCQKVLAEKTDITYTYEPIKKGRGKTSPVVAVKFIIKANDVVAADEDDESYTADDYRADMEYGGHIPGERPSDIDNDTTDMFQWLGGCVGFEFNWDDMSNILNIFGAENIPIGIARTDSQVAAFLSSVYEDFLNQVNKKAKTKDPVRDRFYYFKGVLKNKIKEFSARFGA